MSGNKSKFKLDKKEQLYENKPDFESKTKATKEINQNKKRKNQLKGIYERRSILSAKRQKLAVKKLEKEALKTYTIKALQ